MYFFWGNCRRFEFSLQFGIHVTPAMFYTVLVIKAINKVGGCFEAYRNFSQLFFSAEVNLHKPVTLYCSHRPRLKSSLRFLVFCLHSTFTPNGFFSNQMHAYRTMFIHTKNWHVYKHDIAETFVTLNN